jgi:hypothetical protein
MECTGEDTCKTVVTRQVRDWRHWQVVTDKGKADLILALSQGPEALTSPSLPQRTLHPVVVRLTCNRMLHPYQQFYDPFIRNLQVFVSK